jgi:heterotetrameric sarcosine oxidase gamma subunit
MPDPLRRRSALATIYREGGSTGELSVRERRHLELVQFAAWDDDTKVAGIALPPPCRASDGDVTALWIGPRRWLLAAREGTGLLHQLQGQGGAVVDLSEGRTVLRLAGPPARAVLAQGTGVDVDPDVFAAGACAVTLVGHVGVLLHAVASDTLDIYVPRSYALTFWEWLLEAASERGLRIERAELG